MTYYHETKTEHAAYVRGLLAKANPSTKLLCDYKGVEAWRPVMVTEDNDILVWIKRTRSGWRNAGVWETLGWRRIRVRR